MAHEDDPIMHLTDRLELNRELDDILEDAERRRLPLASALDLALPHLRARLGAARVALNTLDESLEQRTFAIGEEPASPACTLKHDIDVAGESLGDIVVSFTEAPDEARKTRLAELLETGAEVLDNYLKSIQNAREKHQLTRKLNRDLLNPLLDEGIKAAVRTLKDSVSFDLMIVVYHQARAYEQSVRYLVFEGAEPAFDSEQADEDLQTFVKETPLTGRGATQFLGKVKERISGLRPGDLSDETETEEFLHGLGYDRYVESVLISGLRDPVALGKIVVTGARELSTYERDILAVFADALQKRVIDFDKESRRLSANFNVPTVLRLLRSEDYRDRYLEPRREDAAILFTDISGFTRISEQVLGDPVKVGAFIQSWGDAIVKILWKHNGVCDKFVGDCLIGLFGPPFFDRRPEAVCGDALRCAVEIAQFTKDFPHSEAWQAISDQAPEMGVATGLNWCPVSVGEFGVNCGYTAFSPGMNNTARLQGVATRHEVLVMDGMAEVSGADWRFSEAKEAAVKNVKDPLVYRALVWD